MENRGKHLQYWIGIVALAFPLIAYYIHTWKSFARFQLAMDGCYEPFCDFAYYYYPMGETIFRTGLPVKDFVYSPFFAILMAVFPLLELNASLILWGILQVAFIILYLLLFRSLVPAGLPIQILCVALTLSSFPLLHNFTWGQVGVFMTVSILGALFFYNRGHRLIAAALLAFGISFKFFPLIFLVPFVTRRDVRFLLNTAAACGLFLLVVPALALGVNGMLHFYAALLTSYQHFDWVITSYNSQFFPHVIVRLAEAVGYDHVMVRLAQAIGFDARVYLTIMRWVAYSVAAVNMGLVFLVQRARLGQVNLWSFHILFLSIPFVMPTSWPVDLVYIPFGQALLTWQVLKGEGLASVNGADQELPHKDGWRTWTTPGRVIAGLGLLLSIVFSSIIIFNLYGNHYGYGFYGAIFWADFLLLASTYVQLLPAALRQMRRMSWSNILFEGNEGIRQVAPAPR